MRANSLILVLRAALLAGQKALEEEPVGGQPCDRQSRERRGGTGQAVHRCSLRDSLGDQLEAGSEIKGRAGVGNERERFALRPAEPEFADAPGRRCVRDRRSSAWRSGNVPSAGAKLAYLRRGSHPPRLGRLSARNVISPRLPIGVATMCNPGSIAARLIVAAKRGEASVSRRWASLRGQMRFAPQHRSKTPRRGLSRAPSRVQLIFLIIRGRKCHNLP